MKILQFVQTIDESIVLWVSSHLRNEFFDFLMPIVSALGNLGILWIILGFNIILFGKGKKQKKWGFLLLVCLAVTAVVSNFFIKPVIQRMRPFDKLFLEILIQKPHDFSFPSGHTSAAFASAIVFYMYNKKAGVFMYLFAFLMAFSRLYLLVHYPSDILIGALIGTGISWYITKIAQKKWGEDNS